METGQQVLVPWLWLCVVTTLSLSQVMPSSAARLYPESGSVSDAAGASWWSIASSLAAGVLALTAVVGVASLFGRMTLRAPRESSSSPPRSRATTSTAQNSKVKVGGRRSRAAAGKKRSLQVAVPAGTRRDTAWTLYDYEKLETATSKFDKKKVVGQGRAGTVYRCTLLGNDGTEIRVVVKRFHNTLATEDSVSDVRHRVKELGNTPHRNVVRMHGASYGLKQGKLCMVYAYMPEGSLQEHLFVRKASKASLTMVCRSSIIRDVALGLQHLHSHCIVHGSIKASNILLEKDFTARIGDFGHFLEDQPPSKGHPAAAGGSGSGGSSSGREALVYMAPECLPNSHPTFAMDVFCFGAVVLEVVTGRHTCGGGDIPDDGFVFLVDWVWELHRRGCILDSVLDATILQGRTTGGQLNRDVAKKMLLVGLACSHPDPKQRPTMEEVVDMLQTEGVPPPEVPPEKPEYDHVQAQQPAE